MANRNQRLRVRRTDPSLDTQARKEGVAVLRLEELRLRRAGARVTSTIPWAPKKPGGTGGWLRLSERRKLRATMVRGKSNRTPKLQASYVRAFG